ncbi:MAG: hypothetical protein WA484_06190 [Solirubrobacteraceae bacterium]
MINFANDMDAQSAAASPLSLAPQEQHERGVHLDPAAVSVLSSVLSRIADGSLGEAGVGLWRSLTRLVKSTVGREVPSAMVTPSGELQATNVNELTAFLVGEVAQYPEMQIALDAWLQSAAVEVSNVQVSNAVIGNVSGSGNVVQAGRIESLRVD